MNIKLAFYLAFALFAFCISCTSSNKATKSDQMEVNIAEISPGMKSPDYEDVYIVVDKMPELIGGMKAFHSKINYPKDAQARGESGMVTAKFIINEEGKPENITIIRSVSYALDLVVYNAVLNHARFTPGLLDGKAVKVQMSIPVNFRSQ